MYLKKNNKCNLYIINGLFFYINGGFKIKIVFIKNFKKKKKKNSTPKKKKQTI